MGGAVGIRWARALTTDLSDRVSGWADQRANQVGM